MEKEFIPYEQALALKGLSFNKDCFAIWSGIDEINFNVTDTVRLYSSEFKINNTQSAVFYINNFNSPTRRVAAPTFSQAFRWFREKYDLDSNIYLHKTENGSKNDIYYEKKYYRYYIRKSFRSPFRVESENYKTYEEAELECLKKLIEIVKNK